MEGQSTLMVLHSGKGNEKLLDEMVHLQDVAFGAGWGSRKEFEEKLEMGGKALLLMMEPNKEEEEEEEEEEEVVVVGMRIFMPPGTWSPCWPDLAPCSESVWHQRGFPSNSLALARSIIVHPLYQRRGLGNRLLVASLQMARDMGSLGMLVHVWAPQASAKGLATKKRDEFPCIEIARHNDAWMDYSISSGWECPFCGNPCHCAAIEMIYDLRVP